MRFLLLSLALFSPSFSTAADTAGADLGSQLSALPYVRAVREETKGAESSQGIRRFAVSIEQPVDHFDPKSATFTQRLVVFHRGEREPMVLQTSGYEIFHSGLSRLARHFGTNQIQVEHRFFGQSVPARMDWSKLTVRQSAEDFHRIVTSFKQLYPGRWVNTGASKGGMTSVYHRRFYPGDLDGTLADVAPLSFGREDLRYMDFLDAVGGPAFADCRQRLETLQRTLLERKKDLLQYFPGGYAQLGAEVAFEHAVIELPFTFWQYGNPNGSMGCAGIPGPKSGTSALASFMRGINPPDNYGDRAMEIFQPYYFQAALELGGPMVRLAHLDGARAHPYSLEQYLPRGETAPFVAETMLDVQHWAQSEASSLLFIYGEYDPWTAAAFRDLQPEADNHSFSVPGGNHGVSFLDLPEPARVQATAVLSRWLGKAEVAQPQLRGMLAEPSLEEIELRALRRRAH